MLVLATADAPESAPLRRVEAAVKASGSAWTILRPAWFAQNFTAGVFAQGCSGGASWSLRTGDRPVPFIDANDIAAVAAVALRNDGHAGQYTSASSLAEVQAIRQALRGQAEDLDQRRERQRSKWR